MFRFTIRDVLWLTVLVALAAAWWIDHSHLTELIRTLKDQQAELRLAALRAKELRGEVILTPSPDTNLRALERRGLERPRAIED